MRVERGVARATKGHRCQLVIVTTQTTGHYVRRVKVTAYGARTAAPLAGFLKLSGAPVALSHRLFTAQVAEYVATQTCPRVVSIDGGLRSRIEWCANSGRLTRPGQQVRFLLC